MEKLKCKNLKLENKEVKTTDDVKRANEAKMLEELKSAMKLPQRYSLYYAGLFIIFMVVAGAYCQV